MGSKPSRESYQPEWPQGSQEMRQYLYPQLVKGLRGELTRGQEMSMAAQEDAVRNQTAIARERLLRDMGRMPGVPGPERYEGMRRLQEAQIRAIAGIQAPTRIGAQQQAMQQALAYAMQQPASKGRATGPQEGWGKPLMEAVGTAGGMMLGGPAGAAIGGKLGGMFGGGGGGAATTAGTSSIPTGAYSTLDVSKFALTAI